MSKLNYLKPKNKHFIVNDFDFLQKEFYRTYNPDYWLCKICLLNNCHSNFDSIKNVLKQNLDNVIDDDYKRSLRTEMHFLYFQMIETLFEIVFAVSKNDNRNLWINLTFSNWKNNYKEIEKLSDNSYIFTKDNAGISLLRWIFYFVYNSQMTAEEWVNNLNKIKELLLLFSRDFSDRGEYNAYKHSLRFFNSSFSLSIGATNSQNMHTIGSSNDSITYLDEQKEKLPNGKTKATGYISRITKPFDYERDYICCMVI